MVRACSRYTVYRSAVSQRGKTRWLGLSVTDGTGMTSLNFAEMPAIPQYAMLPLCLNFFLAETKRVPFDLPEAEQWV